MITEDMLRAGQDALFEAAPDWTIEERENLAREVWMAMLAAQKVEQTQREGTTA